MPMTDEQFMLELAKKLREVHDSSHQADVAIMELVNEMAKRIVTLETMVRDLQTKISDMTVFNRKDVH